MMNRRIRSMIDEIFSEMKMSAENLALRDEMMANAQARYEDAIAQGKTEQQAFDEVASSLGDVSELLREMNGEPGEQQAEGGKQAAPQQEAPKQAEEKTVEINLGDALNKAFSALGELGQSIMPQAKKLVRQVDDATGGAIKHMGKAVNQGVKDAQKAAGEAIDRMSNMSGEITIDFGKHEEPAQPAGESPEALRCEAENLRAEAQLKRVVGDAQTAQEMTDQADALDAQANALERQAMEQAVKAAQEAAQVRDIDDEAAGAQQESIVLEEKHEPLLDEDGDINEDAFTKVVEQIQRDAKQMMDDAAQIAQDAGRVFEAAVTGEEPAEDAAYTAQPQTGGRRLFPALGLHGVDVALDADDVRIELGEGDMVETVWTAKNVEGVPEIAMEGHTLKIRRKSPDVFKTFFSVFSKNGGQLIVRVPFGLAASYKIGTTSGNVVVDEVDVDSITASTTSGSIRLEPCASARADLVKANTVSGDITISACANDVKSEGVSGNQFISCDAVGVDVDTVSGSVHIEGACESWKVDSVSGDVELLCTVAPTRKIEIDALSATARVALPSDIRGFHAKLDSMSGRIVNEFGPDRYGTCALPIQMDSVSGTLMITRL